MDLHYSLQMVQTGVLCVVMQTTVYNNSYSVICGNGFLNSIYEVSFLLFVM